MPSEEDDIRALAVQSYAAARCLVEHGETTNCAIVGAQAGLVVREIHPNAHGNGTGPEPMRAFVAAWKSIRQTQREVVFAALNAADVRFSRQALRETNRDREEMALNNARACRLVMTALRDVLEVKP